MAPLYEFDCPSGHVATVIRDIDRRNDQLRCHCGLEMDRVMTTPTVHTISTHLPGKSDGGGYYDYNLRDRKTGAPTYIHSLGQKRELLRERGLQECGDDMSIPGAAKRQDDERFERKKTTMIESPRSNTR